MARKGTYYGPFFESFAVSLHGTPIRFGLLIGTKADDTRLSDVIFAAATPPRPDDLLLDQPVRDIPALLKSKAAADFAQWASQHAAAVHKMLPGGLEPCGCFAVVAENAARDMAPLLVPILRGIADPLVLTLDTQSQKLSWWQHSGGVKPAMRPATVKADSYKEALLLWTATPVDLVAPCTVDQAEEPEPDVSSGDADSRAAVRAETLGADVEREVAEVLNTCKVGVSPAQAGSLDVLDEIGDEPVSSAVPKYCDQLRVSFLHSGSILAMAPNPDDKPCIRLRCLVACTVLVLRRSVELGRSIEMLRVGIASSAGQRLQLALEEVALGGGTAPKHVQLPWRALCKPQGVDLPLWCGDYCMPDEAVDSAVERLGQLLGLPQDAFEAAPSHLDERLRFERDNAGTYGPPQDEDSSTSGGKKTMMLPTAVCVATVGVLLLAMAVPFLVKM
mmetsp:Transcript_61100/g.117740  ORF Transcript_61100/g.117740 Transcript_61100/m.117740 type:complete len:447 (-) Transcript_61100:71-1411(-)